MKKKLGFALGEFIERSERKPSDLFKRDYKGDYWFENQSSEVKKSQISSWRLVPFYFLIISSFLLFTARAFDLQILKGGIFAGKASGNHSQLIVSHAPRGAIFDRNGKILALNIPAYRLLVDRKVLIKETPQTKKTISEISKITSVSEEKIKSKVQNSKDDSVIISTNLSNDLALRLESVLDKMAGVRLEVSPIRYYPYGEIVSHVLGYTLEADENDLKQNLSLPYDLGDQVGKTGLEKTLENTLRGVNGYELITVNAEGEKTGQVYRSEYQEGKSIVLSLDIELQKVLFENLQRQLSLAKSKSGSGVVMKVSTGEILALVSIPSFDNNLFAKGIKQDDYQSLISSDNKPLLNRAIAGLYPPGSTFKVITASAGLETKAISKSTKIVDEGFVRLGNQVFNNWLWSYHKRTEGSIDVVRALARSTDTFFYILGQKIGEKTLAEFAKLFGLGQKTGIELPGEEFGLVPTPEWKIKMKGESWYPGETLNFSIGQGDLLVTPIQMAVVGGVFASNGKLLQPSILKRDFPLIRKENFLAAETLQVVREGLYKDTIGDGVVAWVFRTAKVSSAGKTGTAESGQNRPHAWYVGYAPAENPEIVAVVQAEYSAEGGSVAAPVVRDIFNWYFKR